MSGDLVPPGLKYLADNINTKDNILGANKVRGAVWANNLGLPKDGETVFFAGCGYQYESDMESLMSLLRKIDKSAISTEWTMSVAALQKKLGIDVAGLYRKLVINGKGESQPLSDAIKVLRALGIKPAYLAEEEPCCGGSLYFTGLQKQFGARSSNVYERLIAKGAKEIISIVPSCTYTLRKIFPEFIVGSNLQVRHFCEVVAENLHKIKMKYPRKVKVTYHDSCQLVRFLGIVREPRQILNSIENIEFIEPGWTKGEWATCCGGGGGFEVIFPELSLNLAKNRAKELTDTGAEIIVTHCPGCIMQLKVGLKELNKDIEVFDLSQIIASALVS